MPSCHQVWSKPLANGNYALNFVNFHKAPVNVTCDADCFAAMGYAPGQAVKVRDLWQHADLGTFSNYTVAVGGAGASVTFLFSPA